MGGLGLLGAMPASAQEPPSPSEPGSTGETFSAPTMVAARPPGSSDWSCPAPAADDERARGQAELLRQEAANHYREGRFEEAAQALRRAHELWPTLADLRDLGRIELEQGRQGAARTAWERYLGCAPDGPDSIDLAATERALAELRATTVRLTIALGIPRLTIQIDGQTVATTPWAEPVFVDGGDRRVTIQGPAGLEKVAYMYLEPGSELELTLDRINNPPRLDPCAVPPGCIDPPPPPSSEPSVALVVSGGPFMLRQTSSDKARSFVGGFAAVGAHIGLSRTLGVRLSGFVAPSGGPRGFAAPIGGTTTAVLGLSEMLAVASSLSAGYLVAPEPGRARRGSFEPTSSFFLLPELSPLMVRSGSFDGGLRIGTLLSGQGDRVGDRFGLTGVTVAGGAAFRFGSEDDDE